MSEWINVDDELPEDGQTVDVVVEFTEGCKRFADVVYGSEAGSQWAHDYIYSFDRVTHWQPAPKLPKQDNESSPAGQ